MITILPQGNNQIGKIIAARLSDLLLYITVTVRPGGRFSQPGGCNRLDSEDCL